MDYDVAELVDRIESGDADRVNGVIEEMEDMDIDERAEVFEACFDGLAACYTNSGDGYVRQACVRVADALAPGMAAAVNLQDEQAEIAADADVDAQTDTLCGFFLEAMTDEDGRVRQSAQRGLQGVFRTYDALDDRETIEALVAELDEMAADYSGKRREHLLDAREDAEFTLGSGIGRMLQGFREP